MWMANFHVQTVDTRYGQTYSPCLLVHHTPKVPGDVLDPNTVICLCETEIIIVECHLDSNSLHQCFS